MIIVDCASCGMEIVPAGALLFGLPNAEGLCPKDHLCQDCYARARALMLGKFSLFLESISDEVILAHARARFPELIKPGNPKGWDD